MRTIILLLTMNGLICGQHPHGLPGCLPVRTGGGGVDQYLAEAAECEGCLPVRAGGGGVEASVIPCSLQLSIPDPNNVSFSGSYPNLLVTSASPSSLTVSVSTVTGGPWLRVDAPQRTYPVTGVANSIALFYVSYGLAAQALAAGTYNGAITITVGSQRPLTVPVTLTVGGPQILSVAPASVKISLSNTGQTSATVWMAVNTGGSYPPDLDLKAVPAIEPTLSSSNGPGWLQGYVVDLTPGASPGIFTWVTHIDAVGLAPGLHRGTITYTLGSNVQVIPVNLWVHSDPGSRW